MNKVNYSYDKIIFSRLESNVLLPKFQRNLVWTDKRKKMFLNTVLSGNPYGVLLLYKDHEKTGKYIIVDGLQRFTTLMDFNKDPYKYIELDINDYFDLKAIYDKIMNAFPDDSKENVENKIKDAIKTAIIEYTRNELKKATIFIDKFNKEIKKTFPMDLMGENLINNNITDFWSSYSKIVDINDLEIPYIEYKGSPGELPNVFELLNTGGTKLSKYEVFSSSWNSIEMKLNTKGVNNKLLKAIEKKYDELADETEIEIDGYTPNDIVATGKVSLYEYVYALGKLILDSARVLTGNKQVKYDRDDSIGFSTVATFLGLHLKDVEKIKDYLNNSIDVFTMDTFTKTILTMYEDVSEILKPYINYNTKYIEAQIISIVYTWFKLNYTIDLRTLKFTKRNDTKNEIDRFKRHMPLRMLYDILSNYWAGSGDNKLKQIVDSEFDSNRYLRAIDRTAWETLLNEWISEQNNKRSKNISAETRMFLSYVIIDKKNKYDNRYVAGNIFPKELVPNGNLGHVGNVYLYDSTYKVEKNNFLLDKITGTEDAYSYVQIHNENKKMSIEKYENILRKRSETLINKFLNYFY